MEQVVVAGYEIRTWTSRGFPKRNALSKFFLKASSRKLVLVILRSLYSFIMNSVAWPDGSMMSGYLGGNGENHLMTNYFATPPSQRKCYEN